MRLSARWKPASAIPFVLWKKEGATIMIQSRDGVPTPPDQHSISRAGPRATYAGTGRASRGEPPPMSIDHSTREQSTIHHDEDELQRVDDIIKRNDIRFIRLQFSDIVGNAKHVTIPIGHWDTAISHGLWFDGSAVEGFARVAESDMYLVPDLSTFAVVPWEMDLSTARVICDVYTPDGEPFGGDPRYVLKRQLARAR